MEKDKTRVRKTNSEECFPEERGAGLVDKDPVLILAGPCPLCTSLPGCPQFLPGLLFYKHKAFWEWALFHVIVTFCDLLPVRTNISRPTRAGSPESGESPASHGSYRVTSFSSSDMSVIRVHLLLSLRLNLEA